MVKPKVLPAFTLLRQACIGRLEAREGELTRPTTPRVCIAIYTMTLRVTATLVRTMPSEMSDAHAA